MAAHELSRVQYEIGTYGHSQSPASELADHYDYDHYTESNVTHFVETGYSEEHAHDTTYHELKSFIEALNQDDQIKLVALMWIGRGTYGPDEWDAALETAESQARGLTADYLLNVPLFPDYLEEAIEQMDISKYN